ncbi:hypothetical protein R2B67_24130 [Streptomyces cyaneofuscatus]|uniref:hypothetical protein n=1 Tax=Streptomyces cyaneofuscatus TaxID=66883 RepID=UPI002954CCF6|nr:hypothetical protein [Streptomyces cyaneofuscatus]WOP11431.1 hypothetical protein R2B67_24130 [Streptomyces cyaneofuscatus]
MSIDIDAYQHWKAKAVRRPDDVTTTTPLTWQVEKCGEAERRLTGRYLPPSARSTGRATAADALATLALGESIRRTVLRQRGGSVHAALERPRRAGAPRPRRRVVRLRHRRTGRVPVALRRRSLSSSPAAASAPTAPDATPSARPAPKPGPSSDAGDSSGAGTFTSPRKAIEG